MSLAFEWDEDKAALNLKKHRISFDEAKTIFDDPFSLTFSDAAHSDKEQRYVSIGISSNKRSLVVIHTARKGNIRIISCRKATSLERKVYEEGES